MDPREQHEREESGDSRAPDLEKISRRQTGAESVDPADTPPDAETDDRDGD